MRGAVLAVTSLVAAGLLAPLATSATPTRAAWVANANRACATDLAEFGRLPKSDGTLAQALAVMPRIIALEVTELATIRRVPAAPGDRKYVGYLLWYMNDEIAQGRKAIAGLKAGDGPAFQAAIAASGKDIHQENLVFAALGSNCKRS